MTRLNGALVSLVAGASAWSVGCGTDQGERPSSSVVTAGSPGELTTKDSAQSVLATVAARAPLSPATVLGTWNATLRVDFVTCEGFSEGDIRQRQWLIGHEQSRYTVRVLGVVGPGEVDEYSGVSEVGHSPPRLRLVSSDGGSGMDVSLDSDGRLVGQRYVVGTASCFLVFDVMAKRAE